VKSGSISCLMRNIYLYFIILKLFTNFQNIIFWVKIVANNTHFIKMFSFVRIYLTLKKEITIIINIIFTSNRDPFVLIDIVLQHSTSIRSTWLTICVLTFTYYNSLLMPTYVIYLIFFTWLMIHMSLVIIQFTNISLN
jgi:hypothetical protein